MEVVADGLQIRSDGRSSTVLQHVRGCVRAIVCRGVLNDLVSDEERDAALSSFHRLLAPGGLLFLDVREASASRDRADGRTRTTEARLSDGSLLSYASRSTWQNGRILVNERHDVSFADGSSDAAVHAYEFSMRPWSREELAARLGAAGFQTLSIDP
jgi:hypothetical protein